MAIIDFDNLMDKAKDLAQTGGAKAKQLAEIGKLNWANVVEEENIKKAYIEIGKLYYAEKGATPDGAYAAACEKITASKAVIETNNERIAELKQPGDPEPEVEVETEAVEVEAAPAPEAAPTPEETPAQPEEKQD